MGFSLRKSFKVGKNTNLNLSSKSGIGLSTGIRGLRVSANSKGIRVYGGKGIFRFSKGINFKKTFRKIKKIFRFFKL